MSDSELRLKRGNVSAEAVFNPFFAAVSEIKVEVIDVITMLVSSIQTKSWVWSNGWDNVVYGGVSGALYCIGYFLDRKNR